MLFRCAVGRSGVVGAVRSAGEAIVIVAVLSGVVGRKSAESVGVKLLQPVLILLVNTVYPVSLVNTLVDREITASLRREKANV